MELFDEPLPNQYSSSDAVEIFLLHHAADGAVERELRNFFQHSVFSPVELAKQAHLTLQRVYSVIMTPGFAGKLKKGWVVEADPNETGLGLLVFPEDEQYSDSESQRAFMKRHARFLRVKNKRIVGMLPIHPIDA